MDYDFVFHFAVTPNGVYRAPYGEKFGDKYTEQLEVWSFDEQNNRFLMLELSPDGTYKIQSSSAVKEGKFTTDQDFTIWQVAIAADKIDITPFNRLLERLPDNPDGATPPDTTSVNKMFIIILLILLAVVGYLSYVYVFKNRSNYSKISITI